MSWANGLRAIVAALALTIATAAQARWLFAESPNFRIHSDGTERQLRDLATTLEDFDQLLRAMTGVKAPAVVNKLDIYLLRGRIEMNSIRTLRDAAGFYSAEPDLIAAFAIRRSGYGLEADDVLLHEYAHHFMLQYFPSGYPAWYVEGFAEYMMTAEFDATSIRVGQVNPNRASWLVGGQWLPVARLLDPGPKRMTPAETALFYAESWLAVHYMARTPGKMAALVDYLERIERGEPVAAAFPAAFGTDIAAFDRTLKLYMRGRDMTFSTYRRKSERTPPVIAIRALPPSADALLLPAAHLAIGVGAKYRPARLAQVRRDAARFPADPLALRTLARAEIMFGDRVVGEGVADRLLALEPKSADALYLKGLRRMLDGRADPARRAALFAEARPWFVRAFKVAPDHVPTLARYAESFTAAPRPDMSNPIAVMLRAHELAPQVPEITLRAARMLLAARRFDEAAAILPPLASSAHGGRAAIVAQRMLAAAKTRAALAAADGDEADEDDTE